MDKIKDDLANNIDGVTIIVKDFEHKDIFYKKWWYLYARNMDWRLSIFDTWIQWEGIQRVVRNLKWEPIALVVHDKSQVESKKDWETFFTVSSMNIVDGSLVKFLPQGVVQIDEVWLDESEEEIRYVNYRIEFITKMRSYIVKEHKPTLLWKEKYQDCEEIYRVSDEAAWFSTFDWKNRVYLSELNEYYQVKSLSLFFIGEWKNESDEEETESDKRYKKIIKQENDNLPSVRNIFDANDIKISEREEDLYAPNMAYQIVNKPSTLFGNR